jgi:hypothetical protein
VLLDDLLPGGRHPGQSNVGRLAGRATGLHERSFGWTNHPRVGWSL